MLIYTMGYVADDILSSFGLSEEDKRNYDVVVHKLHCRTTFCEEKHYI